MFKNYNYVQGLFDFHECTVWIGGNDQDNEGQFVWSRHGNPIISPILGGHNPNNQDDNEDCIELRLDHRRWNDKRCNHVTLFVSEKDI